MRRKEYKDTETMKECRKCGRVLDREKYFHLDKYQPDGHCTLCKECANKRNRERLLANNVAAIRKMLNKGVRIQDLPKGYNTVERLRELNIII